MRRFIPAVLLVVACLLVYARTGRFQFVEFDDQYYVYQNPHVLGGLNWQTVGWAFTTGAVSNYHPLTWISYALDVTLFGPGPMAFHLENVFFHIVNSLLLLRFFRRATGDEPLAIFVAFVFALHPAHVESVAWISERKDVLSTFFLLLAMLFYLSFTGTGKRRSYWGMVICFAASLLCKQMGVTLPIVLLLLDYWPLRRFHFGARALIVEKIPLMVLSLTASVATLIAQHNSGAIATMKGLPIAYRLRSVPIAYVTYLQQMFWPTNLCAFYPYQANHSIGAVIAAVTLLVTITAISWWQRDRRSYLIVGWLWFTGMLVPVIGLVQVGSTITADRYLYMPGVGLTIMVGWLVKEWVQWAGSRMLGWVVAGSTAIVIGVLGVLSYQQVGYWQDTRTLFTHALTLINQGSYVHMQLGKLYAGEHDLAGARHEYALAAQLAPDDFEPEYDLGNLSLDDPPMAIGHYLRAMKLEPGNAMVENNLAIALIRAGRTQDAMGLLRSVVADKPDYVDAHLNLAKLLEAGHRLPEAIAQYQIVLKLNPEDAGATQGLARLRQSGPSH